MTVATRTGAALDVLTQRLLLQLIASFQRGLPGVIGPLLRRFVAEGFVRGELVRVCWYQQNAPGRLVTPLRRDIRPKSKWAEQTMPQAIAMYDHGDCRALRMVLSAFAFAQNDRANRSLLHRVCEAAAAFGRVDILAWIHARYGLEGQSGNIAGFCVRLAARHGQVAILSWIEDEISATAVDVLRDYEVHVLIQHHDVATLRWLVARRLGVVRARSVYFAIHSGDVAVLRVLLDEYLEVKPFELPQRKVLVQCAVAARRHDVIEYLVVEKQFGFTTKTIEKAVAMRELTTVKSLLDRPSVSLDFWFVRRLVSTNDLEVLALLPLARMAAMPGCSVLSCCYSGQPSADAVRLLLPLSSAEDTAVTLMRFAQRKNHAIMDAILGGTDKVLPLVVVGLVERLMSDSLGPMAALAAGFRTSRDSAILNKMLPLRTTATRDDVRDTILILLSGPAHLLAGVLKADAARPIVFCDEPFLQLCLSLRQSEQDSHHRGIQSYFHSRKKPKPVKAVIEDMER